MGASKTILSLFGGRSVHCTYAGIAGNIRILCHVIVSRIIVLIDSFNAQYLLASVLIVIVCVLCM